MVAISSQMQSCVSLCLAERRKIIIINNKLLYLFGQVERVLKVAVSNFPNFPFL